MKKGQIEVMKLLPSMVTMDVLYAFESYIPIGTIRVDNGHEIVTNVKNRRGKMLVKNYGSVRNNDWVMKVDRMPVDHVVFRADEVTIIVR